MDAVEFCRESTRMCKTYPSCSDCPAKLDDGICGLRCSRYDYAPDKRVTIVEQWAKEHPRKTRQSEFLKQWPNAIVEYEVLTICPKTVLGRENWMGKGCGGVLCNDCRREFWLEEVE